MNSTLAITTSIISGELGLAVALAVFVFITLLLSAFIALLFAWKRFRELFFPTKKKHKQKSATEKDHAVDQEQKEKPRAARSTKKDENYYDDGVPTVPLYLEDSEPKPQQKEKKTTARVNASFKNIPTVVIKTEPAKQKQAKTKEAKAETKPKTEPKSKGKSKKQ